MRLATYMNTLSWRLKNPALGDTIFVHGNGCLALQTDVTWWGRRRDRGTITTIATEGQWQSNVKSTRSNGSQSTRCIVWVLEKMGYRCAPSYVSPAT
jgi:hypothetical protein